jgi:hypothetical protein
MRVQTTNELFKVKLRVSAAAAGQTILGTQVNQTSQLKFPLVIRGAAATLASLYES